MKYIDNPYIQKTYEMTERELIIISLEDIREKSTEPNALGKIGKMSVAKGSIIFEADLEDENKIALKEQILIESYQEIFGKKRIEESSNMHYEMLKGMIIDGILETFGYTEAKYFEDIDDYDYANLDNEIYSSIYGMSQQTSTHRRH